MKINNKLTIFFILVMFLVTWVVLFYSIKYKENQFKTNVKTLTTLSEQIDEIAPITWDQNLITDLSWFDLSVISWSSISIDQLKKLYQSASDYWDDRMQLQILDKMYEITSDVSLLYLSVDKSMKIYDFDATLKYIKKLKTLWEDVPAHIDGKTYIYILFNALPLSVDNVKSIKTNVSNYYRNWNISKSDYDFYTSLTYLASADIDNFISSMSGWDEEYKWLKDQFDWSLLQVSKYRDSVDYYVYWLFSFVLLKNWYFNMAERLAEETLKRNWEYILANQILAYSNFVKGKFQTSIIYYKKLLEIDSSNYINYNFYLWVSYYWLKDYSNSIIYLSQIKKWDYIKDVYRYLILSYYNIQDYKNMIEYMKKLLNKKQLDGYDYYTFFDILFYKPFSSWENYSLFHDNSKLALKYLAWCIWELDKSQSYICIYGKAWFFLAKWEQQKTLKYLQHIIKYYPRDYIYQKLWDIYYSNGDLDKSKRNYMLAIVSSSNQENRNKAKSQLLELILKKNQK